MLVGGFSGSPSLKNYLKLKLNSFSLAHPKLRNPIRLMDIKEPVPQVLLSYIDLVAKANLLASVTAIAHGAVLRAMNKSKGPARKILSSYGFLQTLPKDLETYPALMRIKATRDPVDGYDYVKNTINWLIKKVRVLIGVSSIDTHNTHRVTNYLLTRSILLMLNILSS